ncbi:hypothetical protein HDV03_003234 [Kappamyces sp. JEL0829]|nr:hypothetical protein HDV03_003234 [Kappamyces sp. JEL0829]
MAKFFVLFLENYNYDDCMRNKYLASLCSRGRLLSGYHANFHPSQPNYLCAIAGSRFQCDSSDEFYDIRAKTLVDLLEERGKTWKSYQEEYPGSSEKIFKGDAYPYCRKHNPFMSFTTITSNKDRWSRIVNAAELQQDLEDGTIPDYSLYTPDLRNDGHDTSLRFCADYLQSFLEPLLVHPAMAEVTFLITFDENDEFRDYDQNRVFSVLLGAGVEPNTIDDTQYSHFSQLKFLQERWNLSSLGLGDVNAAGFTLTDAEQLEYLQKSRKASVPRKKSRKGVLPRLPI